MGIGIIQENTIDAFQYLKAVFPIFVLRIPTANINKFVDPEKDKECSQTPLNGYKDLCYKVFFLVFLPTLMLGLGLG